MALLKGSCLSAYKSFQVCKNKSLQIIYGTKQVTEGNLLLILDSSFNPPHWGHYNIVKKSLGHYNNRSAHVLLLLSINNADKVPQPASFDKRMEMMCIMADTLKNEDINVSVGITHYAKYVDKRMALQESFFSAGTMSFLVGFDTITRIFDPKYYLPHLPSETLEAFMQNSEFCCLTRSGVENHSKQVAYASHISEGKYEPTIPRSWGSKIHVLENSKEYENISSSGIRKALLNNCSYDTLANELPEGIIEYIKSEPEPLFQ